MEETGVLVELGGDGVARIRIDRADVGNSLSPLARDALTEAFQQADADPATRAVLLTAAGDRHFCAGAGLDPAKGGSGPPVDKRPGDVAHMLAQGWQRAIAAILDCDKPVVAAVKGTAAGAGASVVLACDLVVMSSRARLVETFVRRGVLPDSGAVHLLTRIVGLRKATELLMLGEPVTAPECERLGIVNRVVAHEDTESTAEDLAIKLAAGPTVTLGLLKRILAVSSESNRDRSFEQEAWAAELVSRTADLHEGLVSFTEGREPRFRGM